MLPGPLRSKGEVQKGSLGVFRGSLYFLLGVAADALRMYGVGFANSGPEPLQHTPRILETPSPKP